MEGGKLRRRQTKFRREIAGLRKTLRERERERCKRAAERGPLPRAADASGGGRVRLISIFTRPPAAAQVPRELFMR